MRNYQPKINNPYILPHNLYMQTLYLIRDYDRLKRQYKDILDETPHQDGQPRGGGISNPTEQKAVKLEAVYEKLTAIEKSEKQVPGEYRSHVLNNVMYGVRYPDFADRTTWSRHRCRFVYGVAKNMKWL